MRLNILYSAVLLILAMALGSCSSSKKISYFQDIRPGQELAIAIPSPVKLQPNDKISIVVSTGDARLNTLFNLISARPQLGGSSGLSDGQITSGGSGDQVSSYIIDREGNILFPVLGKLHVAGMTRQEVAEYIRRELISRDLAKNPIVTVEYLNLSVSVMGEVGGPGRYAISREDYTILDALAAAGDLTIYGRRDNIKVLREENGVQKMYEIDLGSGRNITSSPVYYLQQNDVVYVEPNNTKARQSTPNGNLWMQPTFWMSAASFLTTILVLVIK